MPSDIACRTRRPANCGRARFSTSMRTRGMVALMTRARPPAAMRPAACGSRMKGWAPQYSGKASASITWPPRSAVTRYGPVATGRCARPAAS